MAIPELVAGAFSAIQTLAKVKSLRQRPVFLLTAIIAVLGIVSLFVWGTVRTYEAYAERKPGPVQENKQIQQITTGAGSPAVQGVNGPVTVTIDQSAIASVPIKPVRRKSQKEK